jgi:hypothetical protein
VEFYFKEASCSHLDGLPQHTTAATWRTTQHCLPLGIRTLGGGMLTGSS